MAGAITVTSSKQGPVTKYSCALLSDAAGAVSAIDVPVVGGTLEQIVVTPDGGGTAPSAAFDLTLTLASGTDLMGGAGANLSETLQTVMGADLTNLPTFVPRGNIRPVGANIGNAKGVTMDLYFR